MEEGAGAERRRGSDGEGSRADDNYGVGAEARQGANDGTTMHRYVGLYSLGGGDGSEGVESGVVGWVVRFGDVGGWV
ncbi:hypothetical protein MRB53_030436 [Persea americana]|uniref:Uncharacterized protein n=1 Tax=Persea americana TaxID=3435 RepID=A0ACC2KLL2_PERAE|nr:hypothetical protein MRB53_030436 [Persea americana]